MTIIQIRSKGLVTLPAEIRRRYNLNEGDTLTLVDLGDGCIMLSPTCPTVDRLGYELAHILREKGVSEEEMIKALEEER